MRLHAPVAGGARVASTRPVSSCPGRGLARPERWQGTTRRRQDNNVPKRARQERVGGQGNVAHEGGASRHRA
eukprot:7651435-Lingulodinium_polyedra.AAC.1